jgi:hypothetical protein
MPASRFFEKLPLLRDNGGNQVGLCLMGPIGDGETLVWMSGWAWQQNGDNVVAASTGDAGVQVPNAHVLDPVDMPPFGPPAGPPGGPGRRWMVQTGFRDQPTDYNVEKPVLVQALALVKRGNDTFMAQWSQAVMIRHGYHHRGDDEPGYEYQTSTE